MAELALEASSRAPDGTVRVDAETLGYLLSTVRGLVVSQAEMMRALKAKEPDKETPAAASARGDRKSAAADRKVPAPSVEATRESSARRANARPLDAARLAAAAESGTMRVLMFHACDGSPRAIHLAQVARLEEVDLQAVDRTRALWVMQSEGDLLPLIPFDPNHLLPATGEAPVIVFEVDGRQFGLLIDSVPELVDVVPMTGERGPSSGTLFIGNRWVEMVDPRAYYDRVIRTRFDRRWRRGGRRGAVSGEPALGIPEGEDLFVRKPVS
jgi:hypothetical protein